MKIARGVFLACFLTMFSIASHGADVFVDCVAPGALNAALGALNPADFNLVRISGTCPEDVDLSGFANLELRADPSATIGSSDPNTPALRMFGAGTITLRGITIDAADERQNSPDQRHRPLPVRGRHSVRGLWHPRLRFRGTVHRQHDGWRLGARHPCRRCAVGCHR